MNLTPAQIEKRCRALAAAMRGGEREGWRLYQVVFEKRLDVRIGATDCHVLFQMRLPERVARVGILSPRPLPPTVHAQVMRTLRASGFRTRWGGMGVRGRLRRTVDSADMWQQLDAPSDFAPLVAVGLDRRVAPVVIEGRAWKSVAHCLVAWGDQSDVAGVQVYCDVPSEAEARRLARAPALRRAAKAAKRAGYEGGWSPMLDRRSGGRSVFGFFEAPRTAAGFRRERHARPEEIIFAALAGELG